MSAQEPFQRHVSLQIVNEAAPRISVRIPKECLAITDFRRHYLDGSPVVKHLNGFHVNNHVRPDPEGVKSGSRLSLVVFLRNLSKSIMEEPLQMSPWPQFNVSEATLQELNEGNPKNFAAQALQNFKWSDAIHNNQRVSSHIYWAGLLGWREGEASKPALHALLTELFELNIVNSFTSDVDRFQFRTGEPFPWPILLHRESSDKDFYETWTPKPDFSMFVDGYPRLVIQVCSDPDAQSDLWLVLLSAAAILRTMYEFRMSHNPASSELFRSSIVVVYIKNGRALVYILYLVPRLDGDAVTPHEICYTRDVYTLSNTDELLRFVKLMYLLAQRIKDEGRPLISWDNGLASVAEWTRQNGFVTALGTSRKNTDIERIPEVLDDRFSIRTGSDTSSSRSKSQYDWPSVKKTELPQFGFELRFTYRDSSRSHSCASIGPPPDCVRYATNELGESCVLKICHSKEVQYLKALRHPNIISLLQVLDLSIGKCMVMPAFRPLGKVLLWGDLPQGLALTVSQGLLSGMAYLHEEMLTAHLDIKPDNIVFSNDGRTKIIDFGLAITVDYPGQLYNRHCGTERYMAPEIDNDTGLYDPLLADRYSTGKTLLALAEDESTGLEMFAEKLMDPKPSVRPRFSQWVKWVKREQVQTKRSSSQMEMEVDEEERPLKRASPGPTL